MDHRLPSDPCHPVSCPEQGPASPKEENIARSCHPPVIAQEGVRPFERLKRIAPYRPRMDANVLACEGIIASGGGWLRRLRRVVSNLTDALGKHLHHATEGVMGVPHTAASDDGVSANTNHDVTQAFRQVRSP